MILKRLLILILLLGVEPVVYSQDEDDETIGCYSTFEENKIYPRVNVVPYDNEKDISKLGYRKSSSYMNINGEWLFKLGNGDKVLERKNIEDTSLLKLSEWGKMNVPGNWIVDGKKVVAPPITNMLAISSVNNYVGLYYREISLPYDWNGQTIYLQIGAAKSAYTVWVNGMYVGYSEDSKTPSDFDITQYLKWKEGDKNNIIIQVESNSQGSLLEDKLPKSFNGIERDVFLYSKPFVNISDYSVVCDYQPRTGTGTMKLDIGLENKKRKGEYYVEALLLDARGKEVDRYGKWAEFQKRSAVDMVINGVFAKVESWSEYNPYLYTLVIRLKDKTMATIETLGCKVGFRNVDYSGGVLTINGNPTTIRGVVRGEMFTDNKFPTPETMRKEVELMKANNINAVRIAYAPQTPYFYDLCDEYGIYVFNEANLQPCHLDKTLSTNKDMSAAFVARVRNMYERDKNHPSIIAWSIGNANENGICFEDVYRYLHQKDAMRPVVYSGTETGNNTDFVFTTHKTVNDLFAFSQKKQLQGLIMSEYGSTQGNSFGSTIGMWDMMRTSPMLGGGFISYWNEVEIYDRETQKDKKLYGIIDKAGLAKPYLAEIKKMYGCIDVEVVDKVKGRFKVTNNHDYKTLKEFRFEYTIFSNLKPMVISGDIPVYTKPGESTNFELQIPKLKAYAGEEYFIRFTLKQPKDTKGYKKGYEYDFVEFPLDMPTFRKQELKPYEKTELYLAEQSVEKVEAIEVVELKIENDNSSLKIHNDEVSIIFDLNTGNITSLTCNNESVLASAPSMSFWREPTNNDMYDNDAANYWENIGLDKLTRTLENVDYKQNDKYTVNIDVVSAYRNHRNEKLFDVIQTVVIYCTGDVIIDNQVIVAETVKTVPRVGMMFEVPKSFSTVQWFGLSGETYMDRKSSGRYGTYKSTISDLSYIYEKPQESGNHTDTRWMCLENDNVGLFFDALDSTFDFSVQNHNKGNNNWQVHFDYRNSAVGNGKVMPADSTMVLDGRRYGFKVRFLAYENTNHSPFDFRMIKLPTVESNMLSMPQIAKNLKRFDSPMTITLSSVDNAEIRYTLDRTEPTQKSMLYKKPFVIEKSTTVKARAFKKGVTPSLVAEEVFTYNFIESVAFENRPNTPYNKNMETILFDGEFGNTVDLEKGWLGFSGSDFVAVVKLVRPIDLKSVMLAFAHDPENWAFAPKTIEVYCSSDSVNFSGPYQSEYLFNAENEKENVSQLVHSVVPMHKQGIRYIKIVARSIGRIPAWHQAKGLRPWIMIDEIQIQD